ncbi:MAG: hypothetical protein LQ351_001010 [Letrouitia transgressa]|nr:MAG: hypothetical protein LQ351_001010 [Letrouitia transgressa]
MVMFPPFDYFEHLRACQQKQLERSSRIANLPFEYHDPVSAQDRDILEKSVEELVQHVRKDVIKPIDILRSYGKIAIKAHQKTNCLTEIMIRPGAETWVESHINSKGPLAGIPVSLKDSVVVGGFDVSVGYSRNAGKPCEQDGAMVRMLKDAGAVPYVKTNLPISLLSFESANDLWGRSTNPHNSTYSPGGSTGGEGVVDPSPACARALSKVSSALKAEGHELVWIDPPSPYEGLVIASSLLNSDGCKTFGSFFRTGEWNDPGARQMYFYMSIPRPLKYLYYLWVKYARRDSIWAGLLENLHKKSAFDQWKLVARREEYKARWHSWWQDEARLDFLLTPPNATPAVPHGGMKDAVSSCGYTFLFNLLDYTSGVIPVTHVDKALDQLPARFDFNKLNGVAKGAYKHYDANAMHGLPVGVQVVGQRLQEEKILTAMQRVEDALEKHGGKYEGLPLEL